MRVFTRISLAALLTGAAFSQTTETKLEFEVADVHQNVQTSQQNQFVRGPFTGGGRYQLKSATMVDLISKAYGVDADKVLGGPNWLEYDRFDVLAKIPPNTSLESAKSMLQALLADRFKLVAHKDTRDMPAYALTVGKGKPKIKEADDSGDSGCKMGIQGLPVPPPPGDAGPAAASAAPMLAVTCRNMTMAAFAENLRTMPGAAQFLGTSPVLDKTELQGAWDFDLKLSLAGLIMLPGMAQGETLTVSDALDKQLGLKLDPIKVPLPVVVVESVNRMPTANLPDVAKQFPVAPAEFDVADVKPSAPDLNGRIGLQIQPGGRLNVTGMPLKFLMQQAWGVTNDMIVGAPKWMDTDRWDIIARAAIEAPASAGPGGRPAPAPVDLDTVWAMMRALLADRFKLATHMEDRPSTAYTLVAVKPKMKKADPASRTKWTNGPANSRAPNSPLARTVTFQNMTMAQFAERLQFIANSYIHSPVLDSTGLEGGYDFTLNFSEAIPPQINLGGRGGDAGAGPGGGFAASEPNGGVTLFEAVEKQLGLKLEEAKRPAPFLVIDHVEEKPTDN